MQMMTTYELQRLVRQQHPPCVSIYLPTHRHHPGTEQDPIRFKNLVSRAAELLREKYRSQDVEWFLAPAEELATKQFWQHQEDGLVIFCCPGTQAHYKLPLTVQEAVVVSNTFHTKPIVGYLNSNRHYFVLSLSKNDVQLYEGSMSGLGRIELQSLPKELRDAMGEFKARAILAGGAEEDNLPSPPGQDRRKRDRNGKREIVKYFRAIDRALRPILRDERAPLVLAGVGYLHPLFREACRYPYLLDHGIESSVAAMPLDRLRETAWGLVSAYESDIETALLEQYVQALKTGCAGNQLLEIAKAAVHGRIQVLLHETGKMIWGRLNPDTGAVSVHEQQEQRDTEDADIIDDLCEMTLLKGGETFEISPNETLAGSPLGAIYRY
ncbi:MAG: hypothetical protein JXA73_22285 [Acidobacteria bacterium]|nr:hypothetical protein [Acidobacteriota bacterium]